MESVLIIDSDKHRRECLVAACLARGIKARGVGRVADLPRWPVGDIVVTDMDHLSDWWARVGASRVLALVVDAAEAEAALVKGATEWIQADLSAEAFAETVAERMRAEQSWREVTAQSTFDQMLGTEGLAAQHFVSEAELERKGIMPVAGSPGREEPLPVALGGAVSEDLVVHSGRHPGPNRRIAAGVVGAVLATFGAGTYVYQHMRTAPPEVGVVAAAPSDGDMARNSGVDRLLPAAQVPVLSPELPPARRPEQLVGDSRSVSARESFPRAVPQPGPALHEPLRHAADAAPQTRSASLPDAPRLAGGWTLMTQVESSAVAAFEGLQLGFDVQLQQDGGRVSGSGRKVTENGRPIGRARQTRIDVEGYAEGDRLALTFTEAGTRRRSSGTFTLARASDDHLRGRFSTDAARSTGRVEARRR